MNGNPTYFPVLKANAGEFEALSHLDRKVKDSILPIIEIPYRQSRVENKKQIGFEGDVSPTPTKEQVLRKSLVNACELISKWQDDRQIAVDFSYIDGSVKNIGKLKPIEFFFSNMVACKQKIIPVGGLRNDEFWIGIKSISKKYGAGAYLRLTDSDINNVKDAEDQINNVLSLSNLKSTEMSLLIDLKRIDQSRLEDIADNARKAIYTLSDKKKWGKIVLISSCIPESLSTFMGKETFRISNRCELKLWKSIVGAKGKKKIFYGDYTVIDPYFVKKTGFSKVTVPPKIRYTCASKYVFLIDKDKDGGSSNEKYHKLCTIIVNKPYCKKKDFSWGDGNYFIDSMHPTHKDGIPAKWVANDINHHITLTAKQVAKVA